MCLTPSFCRDLCYYLIRKRFSRSENRAMPLKLRYVPKFIAASRGPPCDSTASCFNRPLHWYRTLQIIMVQIEPVLIAVYIVYCGWKL